MTNPNQEPDAAASIRALLAEMTRRCVDNSCEGGADPAAQGDEHCAAFYGRDLTLYCDMCLFQESIKAHEALLASPPPVSPSPDPTAKLQWADVNALVDFALLLGDTDEIEDAAIRVRLALAGGLQQLLNEGTATGSASDPSSSSPRRAGDQP